MTQTDLWGCGGHYVGYRDGDELWGCDGRLIGRFYGHEVYGADGRYLGELCDGNRLAAKSYRSAVLKPMLSTRRKGMRSRGMLGVRTPGSGYEDFPRIAEIP
ncbi:MAG: 4-fold beta flower protein [Acetobacter aceti]